MTTSLLSALKGRSADGQDCNGDLFADRLERPRLEPNKHVLITRVPDGSHFATASKDKSIKIWSPEGQELGHVPNAHARWIRTIVYAPDGSHFVTGSSDESIKIWTGS